MDSPKYLRKTDEFSCIIFFPFQAIPALGLSAHKQVPKPKIIEEIKTILKSVLKDLERPIEAKAYEKQIAMQVVSVARGLSVLKRAEILALYKEVEPLLTTEVCLLDIYFRQISIFISFVWPLFLGSRPFN